jgi:AcrR family transcriptional regulator
MPVEANRRKEQGNKRELILLAAVEMFLEKDFYQVTITEIAERAGVGKGTVYEYFASKEDLFKECFSYCSDAYLQSFRTHLLKPSTVRQTMQDILQTHLEMLRDHRKHLHLLYNERPLSFQELQSWVLEQRQELLEGITALIAEGIRLKEIHPGTDPEMAGRLFLALNYVVMGGMIVLDQVEVTDAQAKSLLEIYWSGVGN